MAAWTQEEIDGLRRAIASGVLEITYDGPPRRTVRYQNLREMSDQLARMEASAARAAGVSNFKRIGTRKGL